MKTYTLDGYECKWQMTSIEKTNKSGLHKIAAELIKEVFVTMQYLEEVQIEVKKNKYLYLDFFIPLLKIGIEVQGSQHDTYNNFMNKSQLNFVKQKMNDKIKESWCELNNITLIKLNHNENKDEWRTKLCNCGINKTDG